MIRCGRLSVEGEAEEIPISTRISKPKQRHGKFSSNPYSSRGLDKFAILSRRLSAKREYIARKTGTPEDMVRFAHSSRGWVPVVVKYGNVDGGASILKPVTTKQDNQSKENYNSKQNEEDDVKADDGFENGVNGSASSQETVAVIMPWWFGHLKITAFGVLSVSAILVINPAVAMAVVMVVGSLQRRWMGGVMCMKMFVDAVISYFSDIFSFWKRSPQIKTSLPQRQEEEKVQVQQYVPSPEHKNTNKKRTQRGSLLTLTGTIFSSPKNSSGSQELNTQQERKIMINKKFGRIVSMNDQPAKPIRLQKTESFMRRRAGRGMIDPTLGAIVMIIVLFFLVFYGRLSAIFFTSGWWYLMPKFRSDGINGNNRRIMIDLPSREYWKKAYH